MDVVGIRYKQAGKIYYFDANEIKLNFKDMAIVDTTNGIEIAEVALSNMEIDEDKFDNILNKVIRKATIEDLLKEEENKKDAKEALSICQKRADFHNLQMKIVECEYNFDRTKITFYFTSNKRVDFRELVKDLASIFRNRIELRQIGLRDHAKMIKHYGSCGLECCCSRYLTEFEPLSIKMAKNQEITLDPTKISGACGILMCCLAYEEENYIDIKKKMPKRGQKVITVDGEGIVLNNDYIREQCKIRVRALDNGDQEIEKIYDLCQIHNI